MAMRRARYFTPILTLWLTAGLILPTPAYGLRPAGLEESSPENQEEFTASLGLPTTSLGSPLRAGLEEGNTGERARSSGHPGRRGYDPSEVAGRLLVAWKAVFPTLHDAGDLSERVAINLLREKARLMERHSSRQDTTAGLSSSKDKGPRTGLEEPGQEGKPERTPLDRAILEAIRTNGWAKLSGGGYLVRPGALRQKVHRLILQGGLKEPIGLPPTVKVLRATRQTTVGEMIAFFREHQVGESDGVLFNSGDFTHGQMIASLPLSWPAAAAVPPGIEYRIEELEEILGLARKVGPLSIRSFTWVRWVGETLLLIDQA